MFAVCSGIPQSFHSTRFLCHRRFFEDLSAKYCTIFDEKPQKLGVFQNLPMKKLVVLVCSPSRARLNAFFLIFRERFVAVFIIWFICLFWSNCRCNILLGYYKAKQESRQIVNYLQNWLNALNFQIIDWVAIGFAVDKQGQTRIWFPSCKCATGDSPPHRFFFYHIFFYHILEDFETLIILVLSYFCPCIFFYHISFYHII